MDTINHNDDEIILEFHMQAQQNTHWCWAAVVSSILVYYNAPHQFSQQQIVAEIMARKQRNYNRWSNSPAVIDSVLSRHKLFNCKVNGQVKVENIIQELRARRPVIVRIGWQEGGGHFIAIYGCKKQKGSLYLCLADPLHGNVERSFSAFKNSYKDTGRWTHTYYTKQAVL